METPCSRCERMIPAGEKHWTITVQQEIARGDEIEVLDAITCFAFCGECAQLVDFDNLMIPEVGDTED